MNQNGCSVAIATSRYSEYVIKVGAAILKGRRIVSVGFNRTKTTPLIRRKLSNTSLVDKLHAEMSAILKARTDLYGATIYVARTTAFGTLSMSKPCHLCMAMIREAGIKNIYYTTMNGWEHERV